MSPSSLRSLPPLSVLLLLLLLAALQEMEWMGDACNGEQGWIADGRRGRGREIWPVARPDPELTAAVQSHDPPRAKLYHIHSVLSSPLSPLHSRPRPSASNSARCLSVCPSARPHAEQRWEEGEGRGFGTRLGNVHFLNSESRTWRESGETNERTDADACSLKLHTLTGRLLNA